MMDTELQTPPGSDAELTPPADHGETSYRGHGRLAGKRAIITGGDSGIGRAVAIAFAREGADLLIAYLNEHEDAEATRQLVEAEGRRCVLMPGDIADPAHCRAIIDRAVAELGGIDVLVNNAAYQMSFKTLDEMTDEEWERAFAVNVAAPFRLCRDAVPHMTAGASIINTASINSDKPSPDLLPYATSKGAIANFTAGLAQLLGEKGIRVNSVAPGPIWTPLIPSTLALERIAEFGKNTPLGRPGQPAELAAAFVLLASDEASYISGTWIGVTGGVPML